MLSCCVTTGNDNDNENDNDVSAIKNFPERSLMHLKQILGNEIYIKVYCKKMFTQFVQSTHYSESVTNISHK